MTIQNLKVSRPTPTPDTPASAGPAHLGRICELQDNGTIMVIVDGTSLPVASRIAVPATADRIATAILLQQPAVLLFEQGDLQRPIIVGIISPITGDSDTGRESSQTIVADVDGKRVKVVGHDEIVLECGQASITLRRNGRIIIHGTHIETNSEGTNRIKGGQVRIN